MQMKMEIMFARIIRKVGKGVGIGVVLGLRRIQEMKKNKELKMQLGMRFAEAKQARLLAKIYERAGMVNVANYCDELALAKEMEMEGND